jgi:hypothetical protein
MPPAALLQLALLLLITIVTGLPHPGHETDAADTQPTTVAVLEPRFRNYYYSCRTTERKRFCLNYCGLECDEHGEPVVNDEAEWGWFDCAVSCLGSNCYCIQMSNPPPIGLDGYMKLEDAAEESHASEAAQASASASPESTAPAERED